MVPFAFNINLLIGSAPRTLPIRFSMTTTMLLFVIASLLASDPIISAPGAECMAMEQADGTLDDGVSSCGGMLCLHTTDISQRTCPRRPGANGVYGP